MKSMTGYGQATASTEAFQLAVEIKSYNNRYLDIEHTMPFYFAPFEIELDKEIGKVASRGHVELTVRVKNIQSDLQIVVDKDAVQRYTDAFGQISVFSGKALKPTLADYLSSEGVVTNLREEDSERYRGPLFQAMNEALTQFSASKDREGESTRKDLARLGIQIKDGLSVIEGHAAELEKLLKENLIQRIHEMLGDQNYDENRILTEVAVMLVRYSVNEEVKRLETHLKAYEQLLELDEPVGKRLDFLCQEMNREINTIGSKSQIAEMNLQVVRMKDGLENIREQVRNIE
ncbi:MAG: YicC/YloC family endoribonuclease [Sphaerochaetaceae bacterium]|jgi:uncharacterized protein (TIGR00255 family)